MLSLNFTFQKFFISQEFNYILIFYVISARTKIPYYIVSEILINENEN